MPETLVLSDLLRHAGAVMTERDGHPVAAHYGSAPGELVVCIRSVGLAVRSDLAGVSVVGSPAALDRLAGVDGAWACRSDVGLVLIASRGTLARLACTIDADATLTERSDVILNVIGCRTPAVLAALGVDDHPLVDRSVRGHRVTWLRQSDVAALALVDAASAAPVWQAIVEAGRPHGLSCVGIESIDRYALTQPALKRPPRPAH